MTQLGREREAKKRQQRHFCSDRQTHTHTHTDTHGQFYDFYRWELLFLDFASAERVYKFERRETSNQAATDS